MKIICLNTWGGVLKDELRDFLIKQSTDTDIFCFQEVYDSVINPREIVRDIDCNLIKKYNISSTRSNYYKKQDKFADYVFVSNGINISKFKILSDQVSDHLPIMLEFI